MRAVVSDTTREVFVIRVVGVMLFTRIVYPIRVTIIPGLNAVATPFANRFYALSHEFFPVTLYCLFSTLTLASPLSDRRQSMITGELKSKVDRIWDTMWSGGISNPLSVIEQLTYLLFIKRLDELHTLFSTFLEDRSLTPVQIRFI